MNEAPSSARIPRPVLVLGLVSLFMDMGTEMMHAVLPAFLMGTLGAGPAMVGLIDGIAEGTASLVKVFSGSLSDRLGHRKWVAVAGYGLSALVRPLFPLADTAGLVLGARFLDRLGKGVRGAPRDALVADVTPPEIRGAAYGLRQSLDNLGAIGGPVIAAALMAATHDDVRAVLRWAAVPAIFAVLLLVIGVREPEKRSRSAKVDTAPGSGGLGRRFWAAIAVVGALAFARYGESMLLVRGIEAGLGTVGTPLLLAEMSLVYALSSWPSGWLSDRVGRGAVISLGFGAFIMANLVLALPVGLPGVLVGVALWGLHLGMTQGVFSGLIADTAPSGRRGTAFGVFHLVQGLGAATGGTLLGLLWERQGAPAALLVSSAVALIATPVLLKLRQVPG